MLPLPIVRQLQVHNNIGGIPGFRLEYCTEKWLRYRDRQIYDIFLLVFIYILPGFLISFLYAHMGCKLWRQDESLQRQNSCMNNENKVLLGRRRLALIMTIISLLFAVCWLPYYIFLICMDFDGQMSRDLITLYPFALLLGHTNCAQNPILYCFMHRGFKVCVIRIIKCQCRKLRGQTRVSSPSFMAVCRGFLFVLFKLPLRQRDRIYFMTHNITLYLRLYGVRHMVKDHSDSGKGNPLPPHKLLLSINSKGSFICTISHPTG